MNNSDHEQREIPFGPKESLKLHQLRLLEWMTTTGSKRFGDESLEIPSDEKKQAASLPDLWNLTKGVEPYEWQKKCVAKWFENNGRGTVKVVTGGGKTLLAMSIAELLHNQYDKDLHLAIVVPTIVLMHQWYEAILEHSNLPKEAIGRLGGGYDEDFGEDRRILIAVLASASRRLPRIIEKARAGAHLLLIADECHRTGAKEMSQVFKSERKWSLGLSATPEREGDEDSGYDESFLGKEIGPIIYEFNLAEAVREGLVPKFTINHYGLPMAAPERTRYESLSRAITDAMSKLRGYRESRSDGDFFSWARSIAIRNKGEVGALAIRFISDTSKRRELLNHLESRGQAVQRLIENELAVNKDARIILFHESIDEVMYLYIRLLDLGYAVIAEHSELPGSVRETGLELFRKGTAQVIVSARSLIEGFNVPAVDVGIIVASSGSVRQRIQSLGRVLRRHRGASGEEKTSCIHVLYARESSEEQIYAKVDWDATTGVDRNLYFLWDPEGEPSEQDGPPRSPKPTDDQVDSDSLEPGCVYPGQYEGIELSCDSQNNIRNASDQYAKDTRDLAEAILKIKGSAGKFKVTPRRSYVLVRVPGQDDWETRFVTQLNSPLQFGSDDQSADADADTTTWHESAETGAPYPFSDLPIVENDLRFKRKGGGVISKKVRGGELFARLTNRAEDPVKGADAARVIAAVQDLQNRGKRVSKLEVNEAGHVMFREAGRLFFVCALEKGLEFPEPTPSEELT
jgi:superfamily II DNA or RNA helicase